MTSLSSELSAIAGSAFASEGLSKEFGRVTVSDRPDLAQFQCNGALAAAKQAKANPRAIAEKVAARLKADPRIAKAEIAGPGFINIDVTDEALALRAHTLAHDDRLGAPDSGAGKSVVSISADPTSPNRCMSVICALRSSAIACSGSTAPMAGA